MSSSHLARVRELPLAWRKPRVECDGKPLSTALTRLIVVVVRPGEKYREEAGGGRGSDELEGNLVTCHRNGLHRDVRVA